MEEIRFRYYEKDYLAATLSSLMTARKIIFPIVVLIIAGGVLVFALRSESGFQAGVWFTIFLAVYVLAFGLFFRIGIHQKYKKLENVHDEITLTFDEQSLHIKTATGAGPSARYAYALIKPQHIILYPTPDRNGFFLIPRRVAESDEQYEILKTLARNISDDSNINREEE
jgi:signal transduction histidine kinase